MLKIKDQEEAGGKVGYEPIVASKIRKRSVVVV